MIIATSSYGPYLALRGAVSIRRIPVAGDIILTSPQNFYTNISHTVLAMRAVLGTTRTSKGQAHRSKLPPMCIHQRVMRGGRIIRSLTKRNTIFIRRLTRVPSTTTRTNVPIIFSTRNMSPMIGTRTRHHNVRIISTAYPLINGIRHRILHFIHRKCRVICVKRGNRSRTINIIKRDPRRICLVRRRSSISSLGFTPSAGLILLSRAALDISRATNAVTTLGTGFP